MSAKRVIAESILDNFGSISQYVVKQSLADLVFENGQLQRAIAEICAAWVAKTPAEFHAWFGVHVAKGKEAAALEAGKGATHDE